MNKRATYCQKVHYTYISQKTVIKKIKLRCDLYEMHHPSLLQENYYITAENAGADPMGEKKLEIAGAYRMASMNRTGKYGSRSHGRIDI